MIIKQNYNNQPVTKLIKMGNLINVLNIIGWSTILCLVYHKFFSEPNYFYRSDITLEVGLVALVQTFQLLDILLILIGKSKGSLIGTMTQQLGRLVVVWYFLETETNRFYFALMITMWSIAEITRYLYYILKNETMTFLRYHLFIVLYPVGVYGQIRVINDYIKRHASTLQVNDISKIRIVQVLIVIGMLSLYIYLLRMRAKHYSKNESECHNQSSKVQKVEKSE